MSDLAAGTIVKGEDTPPTLEATENATFETTDTSYGTGFSAGTYTDCALVILAPTTGRVLLHWMARMRNDGNTGTFVCPVVREGGTVGSGSVVVAAADEIAVMHRGLDGADQARIGASLLVDGLTPGAEYNVRLEHKVGTSTGEIQHRKLIATPAT